MTTDEAKVCAEKTSLFVNLPLTKATGKIRIKQRSFFAEYGIPVATRQLPINQSCYAEWQIGYDLLATPENSGKTTLNSCTFENYKGEEKFAYELSEIAYYAWKGDLISLEDIRLCYQAIKSVDPKKTFEATASIRRTNPREENINGMDFYAMEVSYPLFVHRFGKYEILAEIMIREKQKAVGTQAMLYVCLPLSVLEFSYSPFGRPLDSKECAKWTIGKEEAALSLELFRVFGMLSPKHRHDVLAILDMLFQVNPSSLLDI